MSRRCLKKQKKKERTTFAVNRAKNYNPSLVAEEPENYWKMKEETRVGTHKWPSNGLMD